MWAIVSDNASPRSTGVTVWTLKVSVDGRIVAVQTFDMMSYE
jgi:hypothetical protein